MPQPNLPVWPARDLTEPADLRVGIRPGTPPVVEICGEIDIHALRLRDELLRVVRRHGPQLALDLAGVTFLDCAGVNVLLATRRRARLEDGGIQVTQASPRAWRTISLLGLQEVFALSPGSTRAGCATSR
jgi:anti-sigma B factor antagonist